jgi:hypothetical protein
MVYSVLSNQRLRAKLHGALIIIDLEGKFKDFISNEISLVDENGSPLRKALSDSISSLCVGEKLPEKVCKPLLLELVSVDRAVIIDKNGCIKSFGTIIKSHETVNIETGARSTAALPPYYHKMIPIKVSSDGEIVVYHSHCNELTRRGVQIKLSFRKWIYVNIVDTYNRTFYADSLANSSHF